MNVDKMNRAIAAAKESELAEMVRVILRRYSELFPEWDVVFLGLPKDDPAERRRVLEGACRLAEMENAKKGVVKKPEY